jgi:hypothetical protein
MVIRRCPACGLVNRPTVLQCECGQGFDEEPEDLRHLHMHRLTLGWMTAIGCSLLLVCSFALSMVIGFFSIIPATLCAGAILNAALKIRYARDGLRALPTIPKAKLLG